MVGTLASSIPCDRAFPLARATHDSGSDKDTITSELHHQSGIGWRSDSTGSEPAWTRWASAGGRL